MKFFNKDKMQGIVIGATSVVLLASLAGTTFAATGGMKSIKVFMGGIKLYVDSKLVIPTDANGKPVEPIIYDGTTYLPMRALSNALTNNQKEVTWDSKTSSAYIGQAPIASQTSLSDLKPYEGYGAYTGAEAKYNILDKEYAPFNRIATSGSTYILDSNYTEFKGSLVMPFTDLGTKGSGIAKFYNVSKTGEKTLITQISTSVGSDQLEFTVDLRGVDILQIDTVRGDRTSHIVNATLSGVN